MRNHLDTYANALKKAVQSTVTSKLAEPAPAQA
jgi:hypothetical protein